MLYIQHVRLTSSSKYPMQSHSSSPTTVQAATRDGKRMTKRSNNRTSLIHTCWSLSHSLSLILFLSFVLPQGNWNWRIHLPPSVHLPKIFVEFAARGQEPPGAPGVAGNSWVQCACSSGEGRLCYSWLVTRWMGDAGGGGALWTENPHGSKAHVIEVTRIYILLCLLNYWPCGSSRPQLLLLFLKKVRKMTF